MWRGGTGPLAPKTGQSGTHDSDGDDVSLMPAWCTCTAHPNLALLVWQGRTCSSMSFSPFCRERN